MLTLNMWFMDYAWRLSLALLLGLCVGSFLNVVIYRLPIMLKRSWTVQCQELLDCDCGQTALSPRFNLMVPASHCPACKAPVPVWSNLPILGFLLVRGRCHSCQVKISWRYPLVELGSGLIFMLVAAAAVSPWQMLAGFVFAAIIIALIGIDWDTFLLPDELTLPLLWLGLLCNLEGMLSGSLSLAVIGAMVGYLSLWSIYWLFKLITGKEGMGYGDFKLLAALGAWLGVTHLISILLISSILGVLYALGLRVSGRLASGQAIPFGPFLGGAGLITWLAPNYLFSLNF